MYLSKTTSWKKIGYIKKMDTNIIRPKKVNKTDSRKRTAKEAKDAYLEMVNPTPACADVAYRADMVIQAAKGARPKRRVCNKPNNERQHQPQHHQNRNEMVDIYNKQVGTNFEEASGYETARGGVGGLNVNMENIRRVKKPSQAPENEGMYYSPPTHRRGPFEYHSGIPDNLQAKNTFKTNQTPCEQTNKLVSHNPSSDRFITSSAVGMGKWFNPGTKLIDNKSFYNSDGGIEKVPYFAQCVEDVSQDNVPSTSQLYRIPMTSGQALIIVPNRQSPTAVMSPSELRQLAGWIDWSHMVKTTPSNKTNTRLELPELRIQSSHKYKSPCFVVNDDKNIAAVAAAAAGIEMNVKSILGLNKEGINVHDDHRRQNRKRKIEQTNTRKRVNTPFVFTVVDDEGAVQNISTVESPEKMNRI